MAKMRERPTNLSSLCTLGQVLNCSGYEFVQFASDCADLVPTDSQLYCALDNVCHEDPAVLVCLSLDVGCAPFHDVDCGAEIDG